MALPLVPIAGIAIRYGAVALATYAVTRRIEHGFFDQRADDAMDDVNEGISLRRNAGQINGTGRFQRTVRLGSSGRGINIEVTALGRIRIRKI